VTRPSNDPLHCLPNDAIAFSGWRPVRCAVDIFATARLIRVIWLLELDTALLAAKVALICTSVCISVSVIVALLGRFVCWGSVVWSASVVIVITRVVVAIWLNWRLVLTLGVVVPLALMSPASHAVWLQTLTLTATSTETRKGEEEQESGNNHGAEENPAAVGRKGAGVAVVIVAVIVAIAIVLSWFQGWCHRACGFGRV